MPLGVFMKTLKDEWYLVIKAYFCSFWGDILYYILHVHTIPTYGVYPHYDVQRELNSITLEGTVSFQASEPCYTVQVVPRHVYNTITFDLFCVCMEVLN